MSITCRLATEADLALIVAFNREAARTEIAADYWIWKYFRNPAGPSGVVLAFDGDRIVGLMAAFAMPMLVCGQPRVAVQLGHNDVLTEYRPRGVYFQLSAEVINAFVMRDPVALCLGVAIAETRDLSTTMMGFDDVGPIRKLVRIINPVPHLRRKTRLPLPRAVGDPARALARSAVRRALRGCSVQPIAQFDAGLDEALRKLRQSAVTTHRDAAYLNWRYVQCPLACYTCRAVKQGERLLGYVVHHAHDEAGTRYGVIDESFACDPAPESQARVVAAAVHSVLEQPVDAIVAWAAPATGLYAVLRGQGFRDRPAPRSLIVRALAPDVPADVLAREDQWYYTIGDSDYWLFPPDSAAAPAPPKARQGKRGRPPASKRRPGP